MYSAQSTRRGVGLDGLFQRGDHVCHFYHSADDLGEVLVWSATSAACGSQPTPTEKTGQPARCAWLCPILTAGQLLARSK
jgi:hypothetical protein